MNVNFKNELFELEFKSTETVLKEVFISMRDNQNSISNILKVEIAKLKLLQEKLLYNYNMERTDDIRALITDINTTIRLLLSYEYFVESKVSTLSKIYQELI